LVEEFPGAVELVDKGGKHPLHYICMNKSITLDVLSFILEEFPSAAKVASVGLGKTPVGYPYTQPLRN
jgi:hypothetical protein